MILRDVRRMATGMLVLVAVLAVVRGGVAIYRAGEAAAEARHAQERAVIEARLRRLAADVARAETDRLADEAERDERGRALEEAGRNDASAGRAALGLDSVRRLNSR